MSFMFRPYPYVDPAAVNPLFNAADLRTDMTVGKQSVFERILALIGSGKKHIAIDGYAGVAFETLRNELALQSNGLLVHVVDMSELLRSAEEIRELTASSLPTDLEMDPVSLYGVRMERHYEEFLNPAHLEGLKTLLRKEEPVIVVGRGALCDALCGAYDYRIWADMTPRQTALNFKAGLARNLGETDDMPFGAVMRRNYYVDFELAIALRWSLIRTGALDGYLAADDINQLVMLSYATLCEVFERLRTRPLRCRPVYLEGVWGGFYLKRLRHLPDEMKNCAWIFDMIPMEVSLAAVIEGQELEVPFFTFVQQQGKALLGEKAYNKFGGYFPLRFNYDDTFHSQGNMSIQCHPDAAYAIKHHGELGRQDESYYVCVAGQDACTYLGFKEKDSCEQFFIEAEKAQKSHEPMDYKQYLHAVPSKPGTQVMIPAGTVHASGHNQVILEIGSLTIGSYTYKLYDYQRIDPATHCPRPIHLKAGRMVIHPERCGNWIDEQLVNHGGIAERRQSDAEKVVGEHDLLYFSLRTETFTESLLDNTQDQFHVLALTEGECVRIESVREPTRAFTAHYLDVVVIPADFGAYRLLNLGQGPVTVHKTMLKDGFEND